MGKGTEHYNAKGGRLKKKEEGILPTF